MNWISVKERLPMINQKIIIWSESQYWTDAYYKGSDKFGLMWQEGDCMPYYGQVTHWMLPEPPKQ